MKQHPHFTFLSDFGSRDHYVASVKGVIYSLCPKAHITDITHETSPHNIVEAAFTLAQCYRYFPRGTVHLAVVDPEVGSSRHAILVKSLNYFFVGPDNGLLSLVCEREKALEIVSIEEEDYFQKPVSQVFHGRDIFGPAAAHVANGVPMENLGTSKKDMQGLDFPGLLKPAPDTLLARVIHIDHFGNIITNIHCEDLASEKHPQKPKLIQINGISIEDHRQYYEEAVTGNLFSLFGSAGYLEIATRRGSASGIVGAHLGTQVTVYV